MVSKEGKPRYLASGDTQPIPIYSRKNIADKFRLKVQLLLFQLCITKMEWKWGWRCLAALYGASYEIDSNYFHCGVLGSASGWSWWVV